MPLPAGAAACHKAQVERFGPFGLLRLLGRGGMAEAYIAERSGESVVLKRIRPDHAQNQEYLRRFTIEATFGSRLRHPNLVRFGELGRVGQCRYMTMELVRGYSLQRILEVVFERGSRPPLPVGLSLALGMLDGLAAMHAYKEENGSPRPIVHRDITPSNIIVSVAGRAVIIDFGIAKDIHGPAITLPGKVIGTARYMAPEHRRAEFIDARADVFSAAVIMYELLVGAHPWPPLKTMKELLRHTFDPPALPEEAQKRLPEAIVAAMYRGLSCERDDRFNDAGELAAALKAAHPHLAEPAEVAAWAQSLGLALDEELAEPVVDLLPEEAELEVFWNASGQLSTGETKPLEPVDISSEQLSIPPLPPRRDASLSEADMALPQAPRWPWVVAAVVMIVLGILGWLQRGS